MTVIKQAWLGTFASIVLAVFLLVGCETAGTKTAMGALEVPPREDCWARHWAAAAQALPLVPSSAA